MNLRVPGGVLQGEGIAVQRPPGRSETTHFEGQPGGQRGESEEEGV